MINEQAAAPGYGLPVAGEHRSPRCFMHIPKCAGMSFHAALEGALAPGALAPRRMDTSTFCGFHEFERLQVSSRDLIAVNDADIQSMRSFEAVSGHFALDTLLEITTPSAIGTILREPRARTISLYMYWRIPNIFDLLQPYNVQEYALMSLDRFLAERRLAPAVDNQVCRMLLHGDPRIPEDRFISETDIDAVASDAITYLDELGFVGVLELGKSAWTGLAQLFGVGLESRKVNVTGELGDPVEMSLGEDLFTADALDLLDRRNAADRIVYDHSLSLAGVRDSERSQLADMAFKTQALRSEKLLIGTPHTPGAAH